MMGSFATFLNEQAVNGTDLLMEAIKKEVDQSELPEPAKQDMKATLSKILSKKPKKTHGLLIAFEGIDGAGKSTQVEKLIDWLEDQNYDVLFTKWNDHPAIKPATKELKKDRMLTPMLYCLLHAADMLARYEWDIEPALEKNKVVVCDRYWYTGVVRDQARGIDTDLVYKLYESLRTPDVLFHCAVPISTAFERLIKDDRLSYYGIGMDLNLADSKEENYIKYESILDKSYRKILPQVPSYCKLDMGKTIDQIFAKVKQVMAERFGIGKFKQ